MRHLQSFTPELGGSVLPIEFGVAEYLVPDLIGRIPVFSSDQNYEDRVLIVSIPIEAIFSWRCFCPHLHNTPENSLDADTDVPIHPRIASSLNGCGYSRSADFCIRASSALIPPICIRIGPEFECDGDR